MGKSNLQKEFECWQEKLKNYRGKHDRRTNRRRFVVAAQVRELRRKIEGKYDA